MKHDITFRKIVPKDESFLYLLYAGTREEELAVTDWDAAQKETFLKQQFDAQHQFYMEHFSEAEFQIILQKGEPIGRLYVDRRKDEIRLIDIALLAEQRGKGIGSWLLQDLMDEAKKVGKPIRIHVERFNPALRLYERLGFTHIADQGVYYLMEWSANGAKPIDSTSSKQGKKKR